MDGAAEGGGMNEVNGEVGCTETGTGEWARGENPADSMAVHPSIEVDGLMSVAPASAPSSWARTFRPSFSVLTLVPTTLPVPTLPTTSTSPSFSVSPVSFGTSSFQFFLLSLCSAKHSCIFWSDRVRLFSL